MPRFVVLLHETPAGYPRGTHFDVMLEQGEVLRTWALAELPATGRSILADQLADHRTEYLAFEGDISGGRGRVCRVASGEYEMLAETPHRIAVVLRSESLRGTLLLDRDASGDHRWRVSLVP